MLKQLKQKRSDKYFSKEIFETKYSKYIENLKTKHDTKITKGKIYIKNRHKYLVNLPVNNNKTHDF